MTIPLTTDLGNTRPAGRDLREADRLPARTYPFLEIGLFRDITPMRAHCERAAGKSWRST